MAFEQHFGRWAHEGSFIKCAVGELTAVATIYRDDCDDAPDERQDGFWPSRDPNDGGYVLPENYDEQLRLAQRAMDAWKNDEWFFCGVSVVIWWGDVPLTHKYGHALWGVECNYPDSDNAYLRDVANELLSEALDDAKRVCAGLAALAQREGFSETEKRP